jgi:hypothetical protein
LGLAAAQELARRRQALIRSVDRKEVAALGDPPDVGLRQELPQAGRFLSREASLSGCEILADTLAAFVILAAIQFGVRRIARS